MRRLARLLAAGVLALSVLACGSSPPPPAPSASQPAPAPANAATPAPAPGPAPAAAQFEAWLTALNSGDAAAVTAYLERHVAEAARPTPDDMLGFFEQTGGFTLVTVEATSATTHTALVKEREGDTYARVVIEVGAAPPHLITNVGVRAIPTPAAYAVPRMSEADALAALRATLAEQVAADRFSGAVLVAKAGKPIFVEAYGLADREKQLPVRIDTRFRIGSMNKMFTAVAALQLVQAGKLKLDAPIGTYLKRYPNPAIASKVTLHHLLTHTGGTGDIFGPEYEQHRTTLRTHADYVKLYGAREPTHAPGAELRYSNFGFVLAGAVIEAVTKRSYYDAVAANLYAKAGMTSTASPPESAAGPDRVVGYMRDNRRQPWKPATDTLPWRGTAAGGGDSTVSDLLAFANALTSYRLLDQARFELATTRRVPEATGREYGYGFHLGKQGDVRCFGHGGGAPGMNGQLFICESGYTIAVLANLDPPAADRIAQFIALRLPAK